MRNDADLVFWQNSLSAHQAPLLRALSEKGRRVLLVTLRGPSENRSGFGWDDLDYGSARIVVADEARERSRLAGETADAQAHVFSGLGAYPAIDAVRRELSGARTRPHLAVLSESLDPRGVAGALRLARLRARGAREAPTIDTVFTIGPRARRQFARSGFRPDQLVPFAYAVDAVPAAHRPSPGLRLIYVASLEDRKDPGLLLDALSRLTTTDWSLTVVGRGPLRTSLEARVGAVGMASRVRFIESLPTAEARREIAESDLLILPSRYDGWGAVVSEALMSGTPVLVSDGAGASELVVSPLQGAVFPARDAAALARLLTAESANPRDPSLRHELAAWAASHISAEAMARWLVARFDRPGGARPAPWTSGGADV